jgi:competence protein ComEC
VLWTAHTVANLPGASITVRQWPLSVLLLMVLGGLWLGLWRRRWRLLGLVPCLAALLVAVLGPRPVLVVDAELDAAARPLPDGRVLLLEWHRGARLGADWQRALGGGEAVRGPVKGGEAEGVACDERGCVLDVDGAEVSLSRRSGAAVEDCGLAALAIARAGPEACPDGGHLLGPRSLLASQGLTVWRTRGGFAVETVAASRGRWPWSTPPAHHWIARHINQE